MINSHYPILAREGWWHTLLAVATAAIIHYFFGPFWAAPLWIVVAFIVQFFRDPPRQIPDAPGAVICPADGKVIALGEIEDPYLKRPAKRVSAPADGKVVAVEKAAPPEDLEIGTDPLMRVSIFMNVFNVHSNRIPVTGKISESWYNRGKFINAALDKASLDNERNALWIQTESGQDVVVVQVAGLIARRILCYVKPGERV